MDTKDQNTKEDQVLVDYIDEKADKVADFNVLAQLLWNKAIELTKEFSARKIALNIIDPCMGGGKLLSNMPRSSQATGYEKDYKMFQYAKGLLENTIKLDVTLINEPFEFQFAEPCFPSYHLAISVPCLDKPINTEYEKDPKALAFNNYAFYVMARSMDLLYSDGYGVFAIPLSMLEDEQFQKDRHLLLKNAKVVMSEKFNKFAIIAIQKIK